MGSSGCSRGAARAGKPVALLQSEKRTNSLQTQNQLEMLGIVQPCHLHSEPSPPRRLLFLQPVVCCSLLVAPTCLHGARGCSQDGAYSANPCVHRHLDTLCMRVCVCVLSPTLPHCTTSVPKAFPGAAPQLMAVSLQMRGANSTSPPLFLLLLLSSLLLTLDVYTGTCVWICVLIRTGMLLLYR